MSPQTPETRSQHLRTLVAEYSIDNDFLLHLPPQKKKEKNIYCYLPRYENGLEVIASDISNLEEITEKIGTKRTVFRFKRCLQWLVTFERARANLFNVNLRIRRSNSEKRIE